MRCSTSRNVRGVPALRRAPSNGTGKALRGVLKQRPNPHRVLQCDCSAPASDGGLPWSGLTPAERVKQAILGYPSAGEADNSSAGGRDASSTPSHGGAAGTDKLRGGGAVANTEVVDEVLINPDSWEWWTAYFNSMDDTVRELDTIDEELKMAVEEEDYSKAVALRAHQARLESADSVNKILEDMNTALKEERYADAAVLRDAGGAGIRGWWVGSVEGDPFGHVMHVTTDFGRYVGIAYSGINIAELMGWTDDTLTVEFGPSVQASSQPQDNGTPVFELFVRRDADGNFHEQVAALHAPGDSVSQQDIMGQISTLLSSEVGSGGTVSVERGKGEDGVGFVRINITEPSGGTTKDDASSSHAASIDAECSDGDMATNAGAQSEDAGAGVDAEDDEDQDQDESIHTIDDLLALFEPAGGGEGSDGRVVAVVQGGEVPPGIDSVSDIHEWSDASSAREVWMEVNGELKKVELEEAVAGVMNSEAAADHTVPSTSSSSNGKDNDDDDDDDDGIAQDASNLDTLSSMGIALVAHRVPAAIEWRGRDSFTLVVEELDEDENKEEEEESAAEASANGDAGDVSVEEVLAVRLAAGGKTDERSASSADTLRDGNNNDSSESLSSSSSSSDPSFSGQLEEIEDLVRTAMGAAIAEGAGAGPNGPTGCVEYTRLQLNDTPTDVLSGIYLGTFGPHGPELLRVARKVVDGEEWVHATKITGDSNVPAGKLSFRAKVGRDHRMSPSGAYPPEYGVMHRYKGQGRVAREGYAAAKWVEGELLTFSAANPVMRGAELGFVFDMDSSRKYLLLFTKVKLDDLVQRQMELQRLQ